MATVKTASKPAAWGEAAPSEPMYRLVWRSYGAEKTGKNHLGLTGPGPIAYQCFDIFGGQNTIEKFVREGKEVRVKKYKFKRGDASQVQAKEIMAEFREDYETALKQGFRTIQWDESELWEVSRYGWFGQGSERPSSYDPLNAWYREMIHLADDYPVNIQFIQKVKEKWLNYVDPTNGKEKGKPSGKTAPYGMKEVGYIVDTNIEHSWNKDEGFVIDIVNCRANMALAGERLTNTTFPELATLIFGEDSEELWS